MTDAKLPASHPDDNSGPLPLAVDLDGTLIRTDCLMEAVFGLLRINVLYVFLLPVWLLQGKAYLKQQIAERVELDVTTLPYHQAFLDYLREQRKTRQTLVLATASDQKFANAIAAHLGLFDAVIASDGKTNLSGDVKRARLVSMFGQRGFDYAANAAIDIRVWSVAANAVLVNPEPKLATEVARATEVKAVFDDRAQTNSHYELLRSLRLHQWLKNVLLFVPLVMAHQVDNVELVFRAIVAFIAFGLCASSVYLLNDLLDLPEDRAHPSKRLRPFAAGSVSIIKGAAAVPVLLLAAFALAALLPMKFVGVLALYYVSTLAYSLKLKRVALLDVLVLAGLYTLRIIAGSAAVSVVLSFWLLAFSMFFFLSLAMIKRYVELRVLNTHNSHHAAGRDYSTADLDALSQFGSSSAFAGVLVLALYINSTAIQELYTRPEFIWLLCPLSLYLIMRLWLLARRNELHDDPLDFVMRDRQSLGLISAGAALLWLAI